MSMRITWSGRGHDYTEEEIAAVVDVMRHGDPLTQGRHLQAFQQAFTDLTSAPHAFALTNCAHALELSAILSGIGPGDEVILPGHTYCASAIPFARTGATVRWGDIDPQTFLLSLASLEAITNERTKVIVVVHLYGMICPEIEEIAAFARSRGILLVEDCAQSLGATRNGRHGGTFGDFATFSFHGQKNLTTLGEGGMLVVRDPALAKRVPGLRHNGHAPFPGQVDYWRPAMSNVDSDIDGVWPHNYSLSEAQAALGTVLLRRLAALTAKRRERALRFRAAMVGFEELVFQGIDENAAHSHHLLVARYDPPRSGCHRDDLIRLLGDEFQIKCIVQFYPLYRYDLFRKNGLSAADCPHTDHFFDNMISFPVHSWMSEEDFDYLIDSVRNALHKLRQ